MSADDLCTVRVYSRDSCCLCDDVVAQLAELQRGFAFRVERLNIDSDVELNGRYGERVPVVEINGNEIGWGRIPPGIIEQYIAQHATRR